MITFLIFIGAGVLGMIALATAMSWRTVVPPSKVVVVQRRKSSTAYGRDYEDGNVFYDVPSQIPYWGVETVTLPLDIFDITLKGYEAYDSKKTPFTTEVKSFIRIVDASEAAQRISSVEELEAQLTDVVRGAVRKVLASYEIENIMTNRRTIGEEFKKEVAEQIQAWGCTIIGLEFMDVRDAEGSEVISDIQARNVSAIDRASRVEVAENTREAEIAEIQAKEATGLRDIERKRALAVRDQEALQQVKEQERETKEKEMAVKQVEIIRDEEIAKQQKEIEAEAQAEVARREAAGKADAVRRESEGFKDGQTNEGLGEASKIKQTGSAEADVIRQKAVAEADGKEKMALALQKFNDAAATIEKLHVLRDVEKARWEAYGQVAANANIDIVNSGKGADILGMSMDAEGGANLGMFLDQLGLDPKKLLSKFGKKQAEESVEHSDKAK